MRYENEDGQPMTMLRTMSGDRTSWKCRFLMLGSMSSSPRSGVRATMTEAARNLRGEQIGRETCQVPAYSGKSEDACAHHGMAAGLSCRSSWRNNLKNMLAVKRLQTKAERGRVVKSCGCEFTGCR